MRELAARVRVWQWTIGFTIVHLAATVFALAFVNMVPPFLFMNDAYTLLDRDPVEVAYELLRIGLTLLHLPLVAIENWLPFSRPPVRALLWTVLAADALLQSIAAAISLRWLLRPPKFFAIYRVPFVTRPTVLLALALAAIHVACSGILYLIARIASHDLSSTAGDAFEVLHPTIGQSVIQPFGLADAGNLSLLFAEALVWAFVTTAFVVLVRRVFFLRLIEGTAART